MGDIGFRVESHIDLGIQVAHERRRIEETVTIRVCFQESGTLHSLVAPIQLHLGRSSETLISHFARPMLINFQSPHRRDE
ncbi:hypothetical protein TNCV_4871661 [Trichonephila clavipes]|nr:hypothetical protein TNCV_4871661 [Trichonephila clavipes]